MFEHDLAWGHWECKGKEDSDLNSGDIWWTEASNGERSWVGGRGIPQVAGSGLKESDHQEDKAKEFVGNEPYEEYRLSVAGNSSSWLPFLQLGTLGALVMFLSQHSFPKVVHTPA